MAWNHNARNRSAEVRKVNYHEDGPNSTSSNSNKASSVGGDLNPFGKVVVGGICLFALGVAGLDVVSNAILSTKDTVDNVKEVVEYVNTTTSSNTTADNTVNTSNSNKLSRNFNIEDELELESEDVKDILDFLTEQLRAGEKVGENVVIIDKSAVENDDTYKEQILDKLSNYNKDVSFVIVYTDLITVEDAEAELYRVNDIKSRNLNTENASTFNKVHLTLKRNTPNTGECTLVLSFTAE